MSILVKLLALLLSHEFCSVAAHDLLLAALARVSRIGCAGRSPRLLSTDYQQRKSYVSWEYNIAIGVTFQEQDGVLSLAVHIQHYQPNGNPS